MYYMTWHDIQLDKPKVQSQSNQRGERGQGRQMKTKENAKTKVINNTLTKPLSGKRFNT